MKLRLGNFHTHTHTHTLTHHDHQMVEPKSIGRNHNFKSIKCVFVCVRESLEFGVFEAKFISTQSICIYWSCESDCLELYSNDIALAAIYMISPHHGAADLIICDRARLLLCVWLDWTARTFAKALPIWETRVRSTRFTQHNKQAPDRAGIRANCFQTYRWYRGEEGGCR